MFIGMGYHGLVDLVIRAARPSRLGDRSGLGFVVLLG